MSGSTIILGQKIVLPSFFQRSDFYYKMKKNLPTARFSVKYWQYILLLQIFDSFYLRFCIMKVLAKQKKIYRDLPLLPTIPNPPKCRFMPTSIVDTSSRFHFPLVDMAEQSGERAANNEFFFQQQCRQVWQTQSRLTHIIILSLGKLDMELGYRTMLVVCVIQKRTVLLYLYSLLDIEHVYLKILG